MVGMDKGVLTEIEQIKKHLVLPAIAAPMFLVSGPALVIEACKAGIIGCFPTMNAKDPGLLDEWFQTISDEVAYPDKRQVGPWSANIIVHSSSKRFDSDFKLLLEYKPRLVITALGSPKRVCDKVHEYGGLVFADVSSVVFAKKAVAAGVDGLVLVSAGAGGHTGSISGFSFVPAIRSFFDGPIVLGGGIANGAGIKAAEILGADLAYVGTRFIATNESLASDDYKDMLAESTEDEIVLSNHFSGINANYLGRSLAKVGLDPNSLSNNASINLEAAGKKRAWVDIWSAGHSVRAITHTQSVSSLVKELTSQYEIASQR
jgi:nitronate monooxygenase